MATTKTKAAAAAPAKTKAAALPAKKPGTALVNWQEVLAARAAIAKKSEAAVSAGSWLSISGGVLSYGGNPVPGNKLDVVVLDSVLENVIYFGKFDRNVPQSPACYAFGRNEDEMAPHAEAPDKQSTLCASCPQNEWASSDTGRGKACSNVRRLALIPADALDGGETGVQDAEVAFFKVSVTSAPNWTNYVKSLADQGRPPFSVVTEIAVIPDGATQHKITFKARELVDDGELLGALMEGADKVGKTIEFPYKPVEEAPPKPTGRGSAKPAGRGTAAKPAAKPAANLAGLPTRKPVGSVNAGVSKPAKRAAKY